MSRCAALVRATGRARQRTAHRRHALLVAEKYPVRDPFFNMLKRSLNTFMNAWTGATFARLRFWLTVLAAADHTSYPFSTQNAKDFDNLLSVYLDATFHPILHELGRRARTASSLFHPTPLASLQTFAKKVTG